LKLAACIGNQFDLNTLAIVYEKSPVETAVDLWRALQEGLIIPISDVYKFFQSDSNQSESTQVPTTNYQLPTYRFLHDRVQQAAYFLIPEDQKQSTHLKIGQLLLSNTPEQEREEKLFDIVNSLNYGVELITHPTEREELAQLNLLAGRKARASTAYVAAVGYLTVGMGLLAADSWTHQYDLTLALYEEATEAAYLSGDYAQMDGLIEVVRNQAKKLLDKVKVYEVQIQALMVQNKLKSALQTALEALSLLGVSFPEQPNLSDFQLALSETQSKLIGKRIEDLINLPIMSNPNRLAALRLLSSFIACGYIAAPEFLPLIAFKQVSVQIE
jgi:predicted ATPase